MDGEIKFMLKFRDLSSNIASEISCPKYVLLKSTNNSTVLNVQYSDIFTWPRRGSETPYLVSWSMADLEILYEIAPGYARRPAMLETLTMLFICDW